MKNEPEHIEQEGVISPEQLVIASSLGQTGQNQKAGSRKLSRKWFGFSQRGNMLASLTSGMGRRVCLGISKSAHRGDESPKGQESI